MDVYIKNIGGVWFGVVCQKKYILATNFGSNEKDILDSLRKMVQAKTPMQPSPEPSAFADNIFSIMKCIYDGKGTEENIPFSMEQLPVYRQRVLRTVARIPVGYVSSYGGVADAIGGGARAVGNAMANNPFAPLVPCHRVVTSNMGLGGYGGNLRVKFDFLKREKRGFDEPKGIVVDSGILKVFPVEFVLDRLEKSIA